MNNKTFVVRRGRDPDWAAVEHAVAEIQEFERALVGYPLKPGKNVWQAYIPQLRDNIESHQGCLFIAETNGEIIGILAGYVDRGGDTLVAVEFDRSAYISELFVNPAWRRQGVAASLMHEFERTMRQMGLEWATVCVKSKNVEAFRAYQDCGYEEYEVVLAKRLPQSNEGGART